MQLVEPRVLMVASSRCAGAAKELRPHVPDEHESMIPPECKCAASKEFDAAHFVSGGEAR